MQWWSDYKLIYIIFKKNNEITEKYLSLTEKLSITNCSHLEKRINRNRATLLELQRSGFLSKKWQIFSQHIHLCMPNFKSQSLKIKEIYVIVLSILFILLVQVTGGFLPLTAAKFRLVWKISDQSIKTSPRIYATYFNKVLCIRGMWVGYFSIQKLLILRQH